MGTPCSLSRKLARRFLTTLVSVGLMSGCVGHPGRSVRIYDGPQRPIDGVAIVQSDRLAKYGTSMFLMSIDGVHGPDKNYGWSSKIYGNYTIELLPGKHTLEFRYAEAVAAYTVQYSRTNQSITFTAEPGKIYLTGTKLDGDSWEPQLYDMGPIPQGYKRPIEVVVVK